MIVRLFQQALEWAAGHHDDMMRISSQYAAMVSTQRAGLFAA